MVIKMAPIALLVVVLLMVLPILGKLRPNYDIIGKPYNKTDKQFLEDLLRSVNYDAQMRPEALTVVNVSIILLSLTSPDESSVTYEVGFVMEQKWFDPRLVFSTATAQPSSAYLNGLRHAEQIWLPDTYFVKHGEFKEQFDKFDPLHIALKIYGNGTVLYTTRRNMIINCEGNLRIFPFDSPKCFFGIESILNEKDQLKLSWDVDAPLRTSDSMKTINAYMIRNETNKCNKRHTWRREYSCLSVLLVFSRDQSFYFTTVFLPGMVLVTSSFISFWLDVNAVPARVMIAVTTMLNFCTTTNSFRSKLPVVSNLYALNLWDFVCTLFIYMSMIEFIIVNYIYRLNRRPTKSRGGYSRQSVSSQDENFPFQRKSIRRSTKHDLAVDLPNHKEKVALRATLSGGPMMHESTSAAARSELIERRSLQLNNCSARASDIQLSPLSDQRINADAEQDIGPTEAESLWQMQSFINWLRRPYLISAESAQSNVMLAQKIDHVSKSAFILLFSLFTFFYFLTYAFIKPSQLEDWIELEFEATD